MVSIWGDRYVNYLVTITEYTYIKTPSCTAYIYNSYLLITHKGEREKKEKTEWGTLCWKHTTIATWRQVSCVAFAHYLKMFFSAFDRLLNFSLFSRPSVSENTRQNQKVVNAIKAKANFKNNAIH